MNNNLSVEQKLAKLIIDLRKLRPFYSAVYETMEKVDMSDFINTISVTANKILYNYDFVDSRSYAELKFIILHEVAHIALLHVSRMEKRDRSIWNIAADLIVNALLIEEFNTNTKKIVLTPGSVVPEYGFTIPSDLLYCDTIDIETQSVVSIYNDISELVDNSNGADYVYYRGTKQAPYSDYNKIKITIKGFSCDLIDNGADPVQQENDNNRIVHEALTRLAMSNSNASQEKCLLERKAVDATKSCIDWRKWITKHVIKIISKDTSFNSPDKRMYYQKAIYPGQISDYSNLIKNVKICIDTSGSISDDEVSEILGHIAKLASQFKIEAEVISWDTEIKQCGIIKSNKDIMNIKLYGYGGTDPDCLFEYFDSKECKVKPSIIIVFTDGFWKITDNNSWKRKYKDTLWVITDKGNKNFNEPFGRMTKYSGN